MTRNDTFFSIDQLEKDFDRAVISLDQQLIQNNLISATPSLKDHDSAVHRTSSTQVVSDPCRNNLSILTSSFSTLLQYTLTLAELNAKLEAELLDIKSDLVETRATNESHTRLEDDLVHQLHAAQLSALQDSINSNNNNNNKTDKNPGDLANKVSESIEKSIATRREEIKSDECVVVERDLLKRENENLRDILAKNTNDLYAARLASKYLDKELAGRIQQIQLIGKGKMSTEEFGKLWTQLESEIFLHRQKTLVQACRATLSPSGRSSLPSTKKVRQVKFLKNDDEQLGLSITGGDDVGCPIIVSEIIEHGVAARTGEIYVGDAILAINGHQLKGLKHGEAAAVLSNAEGVIVLEVQFLVPELQGAPVGSDVGDAADSQSLKDSVHTDAGVVEDSGGEIDAGN